MRAAECIFIIIMIAAKCHEMCSILCSRMQRLSPYRSEQDYLHRYRFRVWKNMRKIILIRVVIIRKQFKMNLVCNTVFNGNRTAPIERRNLKDLMLSENRLAQKPFNFCIHRPFQCRYRLLPLSHLCKNDASCFLATHALLFNMCASKQGTGRRHF